MRKPASVHGDVVTEGSDTRAVPETAPPNDSLALHATARNVFIGGRRAMREADRTVEGTLQIRSAMLGPGVVVDASRRVKIEGRWAARVGDQTVHREADGAVEDCGTHKAVIAGPGVSNVWIG